MTTHVSGRPPWAWARVVLACSALTDGEKLVWLADQGFAIGPEGSWISHESLGRRLAKSGETIKATRWRLKQVGLYDTAERVGARQSNALSWFPTLPAHCRTGGPKPTDKEVELLATELASHVAVNRGSRASSTGIHGTVNAHSRERSPASTREGGEGGGSPLGAPLLEEPLPPAVTKAAAMTEAEEGVFARANERRGGTASIRELLDPVTRDMLEDLRRAAGGEG